MAVTGEILIQGPDAPGTPSTGNPLQVAGNDGTDVRTLSTDSSGKLNVNATTTPSGTQDVNLKQVGGSTVSATNPVPSEITDGTNGVVAVKPASTAPSATDKALVVAMSPNSASPELGSKSGGTAGAQSALVGGVNNTSAPSLSNGQQASIQLDLSGNVRINPTGQIGSYASVSSTPAAGAQLALSVPAGTKYKLKACRIRLVTSSTSATRTMRFGINDAGGNSLFLVTVGESQAASLTHDYQFGPSLPFQTTSVSNNLLTPFPEVVLGPSFSFVTSVLSIQTTDQISFFADIELYND